MNPSDILKYGHTFFLKSLAVVPTEHRTDPGACGRWSVQDLLAHITSYEWVLVEILETLQTPGPTPTLDEFKAGGEFNDAQVDRRQGMTYEAVLAEYDHAHARVRSLVAQLPAELWRQNGVLPWYGAGYDLEDFIVYTYYGHKREHGGQIQVFRDRFVG